MIDMRYYVISLVAVFLALGIGILLGTTLVEKGLISEQKAEISALRKTFDQIKVKNKELNDDLSYYKQYASQSNPYITGNRLVESSFAIVTEQGVPGTVPDRCGQAIAGAGGTVSETVSLAGPDAYANPDFVNRLAAYYQVPPDAQTLKAKVYADVAGQLATASNPALLNDLQGLGACTISAPLTAPVAGVALYTGDKEDAAVFQKSEVPLAQAFEAAGLLTVAVGGTQTDEAIMLGYKAVGLATVDHVEDVPGQVALVLSLAGQPGNYGRGKAASSVLPPAPGT